MSVKTCNTVLATMTTVKSGLVNEVINIKHKKTTSIFLTNPQSLEEDSKWIDYVT